MKILITGAAGFIAPGGCAGDAGAGAPWPDAGGDADADGAGALVVGRGAGERGAAADFDRRLYDRAL